jgi:hypothetical protein
MYTLLDKKKLCTVMKKKFLFLSCFYLITSYAQEVQLIHDFNEQEMQEKILSPSSSYHILQDALNKKKIFLRCLDKNRSALYTSQDKKNHLANKLQSLLSKSQSSLTFSDDPTAFLIFWNLPSDLSLKEIKKIPSDRLILFAFDPSILANSQQIAKLSSIFSKIYTLNDDLVDDKKFFKFYMPALKQLSTELPNYNDKKLCAVLSQESLSNQESNILSFFERKEKQNILIPSHLSTGQNIASNEEKVDTLKQYRFAICYETNSSIKGHITDRIFECFSAGCVPIYLGAPNVCDYIPKHCFIDPKEFPSHEELYQHLKNMDESTYYTYLNNIKSFLESKEAQLFSVEEFTKTFTSAIKE